MNPRCPAPFAHPPKKTFIHWINVSQKIQRTPVIHTGCGKTCPWTGILLTSARSTPMIGVYYLSVTAQLLSADTYSGYMITKSFACYTKLFILLFLSMFAECCRCLVRILPVAPARSRVVQNYLSCCSFQCLLSVVGVWFGSHLLPAPLFVPCTLAP